MSRLYDRIMADRRNDFLRKVVSKCTVISVDDLCQYSIEQWSTEIKYWSDIPTVMPPFRECWIETRKPAVWGKKPIDWDDEEGIWLPSVLPQSWGCEITKYEYELDDLNFLMVNLIVEHRDRIDRVARVVLDLDANGRIFSQSEIELYDLPDTKESHLIVQILLIPFLFGLALANSKNVVLVDNPPPPKLSKRHEKDKGQPLVNYKTIKVNPMRTAKHATDLDTQNAPRTPSEANLPLSIWRGHFKDFRDGKGLFGNPALKGVYWWDQHVRGSIENGVNIKDYVVQAPTEKR